MKIGSPLDENNFDIGQGPIRQSFPITQLLVVQASPPLRPAQDVASGTSCQTICRSNRHGPTINLIFTVKSALGDGQTCQRQCQRQKFNELAILLLNLRRCRLSDRSRRWSGACLIFVWTCWVDAHGSHRESREGKLSATLLASVTEFVRILSGITLTKSRQSS